MKKLIKNVQMLEHEEKVDVLIHNGKVTAIGKLDDVSTEEVIDGQGNYLFPGFVDVHIHLREPGGEAKETIESGTMAAAKGGFTTVCAMPNTNPVPDDIKHLSFVNEKIERDASVHVLPYASITKSQKGEELVDFQQLKDLGAVAFTDDGVGVQSAGTMFEAMKQVAAINGSIVAHCEDNSLIYEGVMHDGEKSEQLDLAGIPSVCESVQIARDVLLAEATGCHYHVCHVSTKESVRVIRDAKQAGINVTAEVTPHHLLLNEDDIPSNNANYKMNPPLRSNADQEALFAGLLDGTLDCIATDHAPHTAEEKSRGFEGSPFGIIGLETAFPLLYTHLVKTNKCTLKQLVDWLTVKPAELFSLTAGEIAIGQKADLVLVNLNKTSVIDESFIKSKGRNTPFKQWQVEGCPVMTFVEGEIVWQEDGQYV
ncbi:dihydroorotase [Halalkalibacillus sediminis]|uniref:Dihydroorotase n=1 Tax=Halalkalibacillus sediminis TaxID=2018042 RepID=A0A2I0QW76_9BACI|nr:dihydroorotase [Halalkalibacillus sediminis]PKR78559.1 dihydroorotase [Halalkalibacillus sediminis]